MGFLALYFATVFLLLGLGLYPLLQELFPQQDPLKMANRYLLLWLAVELVVRFMLQSLPVISIKPLLTMPVSKRKIVNYVLIKSFFSFFNLLPLLVIVPFGFFIIYKSDYNSSAVFAWMLAVFALSLCVNYANFLLKKKFADNLKDLLPYVFGAFVLAGLDYAQIFSLKEIFGSGMDYVVQNPVLALIPVLFASGFYKWNQFNLERKFYLDDSLRGRSREADTNDYHWARKFGDIAPFLQLDLKLIWRNKRPKTTVWFSLLIVAYGLIFYPQEIYQDMPAIFVFVGIFMTGIFMVNFGQFIPAWDATYYSMIMTQNIPLKKYLASKAGLITVSIVVLTLLTTPYVYFGWNVLLMNLACAIYNIGVNVPIILFAGSFNRKRIELEKSPFMNYQGTGATQWLVGLPLIIIPVLIFWPLNRFVSYEFGVVTLAGLGVLGILLRSSLLSMIERFYQQKKYIMIQGFKQTGE